MTLLINDPAEFAGEALAAYALTEADRVMLVPGGVVRSTATPTGQVAVVMGGGSGHFPAFAGWVGVGFGHGAACGNIFASPSQNQILSVARAADNGGGVLFVPINYAGDILHFTAAAEQLQLEGIDARLVAITDDIASGDVAHASSRRGIAGSFLALKMVGAAAEAGMSLDDVERIAVAVNAATRTLGVALSGCTLPGSDEPLFTVPRGRMAVGLGIHGEPGISEVDLGSSSDTADLIVDALFAERPAEPGRKVAVLVNGLGATKYDELFVIFGRVRERIEHAGMQLVAPVVGEQVTSLDMAGFSVSLAYLDDELEPLWLDPANTHSFSRGEARAGVLRTLAVTEIADEGVPSASAASRGFANWIVGSLSSVSDVLATEERRLGDIDAVAGDGDHGIGMLRGARAAATAAAIATSRRAGLGTTLQRAGTAWSDEGGGTSGALWGAGLSAAGQVMGDFAAPSLRVAARAFLNAIVSRGGAVVGDKTMVDAIVPFVDKLEAEIAAGADERDAWVAASMAATIAAQSTATFASRIGRSRIHGGRSIGTPDAGAVSFALIVSSVAR